MVSEEFREGVLFPQKILWKMRLFTFHCLCDITISFAFLGLYYKFKYSVINLMHSKIKKNKKEFRSLIFNVQRCINVALSWLIVDEPQQKCNTSSSSHSDPPRWSLDSLYWSSKLTFSEVPPSSSFQAVDKVQFSLKQFLCYLVCVLQTDLN